MRLGSRAYKLLCRLYRSVLRNQRIAEALAAIPDRLRKQPVSTVEQLEPRLMLDSAPLVSLSAIDPDAAEEGPDRGVIRVQRDGPTDTALAVNCDIGGTASAADYSESLGAAVLIPEGRSFTDVVVTPIDDSEPELTESLTLTLIPGSGYVVDTSAETAAINIESDDPGVVPVGDTFPVNTTTKKQQQLTEIHGREAAMLPGGGFVIVWNSRGQDGSRWGVFGQVFDASGNTVGGEFQVNTYTSRSQCAPSVAADSEGNFVVTWTSAWGRHGNSSVVCGRRFDAAGNPLGGEFRANNSPGMTDVQMMSDVTFLDDGRFLIVWSGDDGADDCGVYGRIFDSDGTPLGGAFAINRHISGFQLSASAAATADGGFVVTWTRYYGGNPCSADVFAHTFDAAGQAAGPEFRVNTTTQWRQQFSSVAAAPDGGFVIVWQSDGIDGWGSGIAARRFDA